MLKSSKGDGQLRPGTGKVDRQDGQGEVYLSFLKWGSVGVLIGISIWRTAEAFLFVSVHTNACIRWPPRLLQIPDERDNLRDSLFP